MNSFERILSALAGVPVLRGALCRHRHHLFDPAVEDEAEADVAARHTQAIGLCGRCPALPDCDAWVSSLPPARRPLGVVAGRVYTRKARRQWTA